MQKLWHHQILWRHIQDGGQNIEKYKKMSICLRFWHFSDLICIISLNLLFYANLVTSSYSWRHTQPQNKQSKPKNLENRSFLEQNCDVTGQMTSSLCDVIWLIKPKVTSYVPWTHNTTFISVKIGTTSRISQNLNFFEILGSTTQFWPPPLTPAWKISVLKQILSNPL